MRRIAAAVLLVAFLAQTSGGASAATPDGIVSFPRFDLSSVIAPMRAAVLGSQVFAQYTGGGTLWAEENAPPPSPEPRGNPPVSVPVPASNSVSSTAPLAGAPIQAPLMANALGIPQDAPLDPLAECGSTSAAAAHESGLRVTRNRARMHAQDTTACGTSSASLRRTAGARFRLGNSATSHNGLSVAPTRRRTDHVGPNDVHLGGRAAHQSSLRSEATMSAAIDVSTNGTATTGIEPWWTYEEGELPGVGRYMINVGTGNLVVQSDDVDIPEPGIDLAFRRTYNSQSSHDIAGDDGVASNYGEQWTNTFDAHLVYDGTNMILYDIDGASCTFKPSGSGDWNPCAGYAGTSLTLDYHSCGYLWTKKNGTIYHFFSPTKNCTINGNTGLEGRLYEIVARNNTDYIHFKYAADSGAASLTSATLNTITATHSNGDALTLKFADVACTQAQGSTCRLLSTITRPDGQKVIYSYTAYARPSQVSKPFASTVSIREQYVYAGGLLQGVVSPNSVAGQATGNTTNFTLDASGNVDQIVDDGTVNFKPNDGIGAMSQPLQSAYPIGVSAWRTRTFTYDNAPGTPDCVASGQACTYVHDTDGHATKWQIDGKSRVVSSNQWSVSSKLWLVTSMTWENTNNDLLSTTDANQQETDYAYDDSGNTVEVAEPKANGSRPISTYSYSTDGFNNLLAYCDPLYNTGLSWSTSQVGASDSKCAGGAGASTFTYTTTGYDAFGDLTVIKAPSGYK